MTRTAVRVVCDEASHAPKVERVGLLRLPRTTGDLDPLDPRYAEDLLDDDLVDLRTDAVTWPRPVGYLDRFDAWADNGRRRWVLTCTLCGLRVELRNEKAVQLVRGLLAAGVSEVRLSALAASLS